MATMKIRYKGLSDNRIISVDDIKPFNVLIDRDLAWTPHNRHTIYIDGLSPALEDVLRAEGTFQIEEVDPKSGEVLTEVVQGSVIDDTGDKVVDKSEKKK